MEDGAYFRAQAEEVLSIANSVADRDAKRELMGIAEECEELAKRADDRGGPDGPTSW
jgi:hypothetical protein